MTQQFYEIVEAKKNGEDYTTLITSEKALKEFVKNGGYKQIIQYGPNSSISKPDLYLFTEAVNDCKIKLLTNTIKKKDFRYLAWLPVYLLYKILIGGNDFFKRRKLDYFVNDEFIRLTACNMPENKGNVFVLDFLKNLAISYPETIDFAFERCETKHIYSILTNTKDVVVAQKCLKHLMEENAIPFIRRYFNYVLQSNLFKQDFSKFREEYLKEHSFNNAFARKYSDLDFRIFDFNDKFKKEIERELNKNYESTSIQSNNLIGQEKFWKELSG